jgi:hypothetical protein
LPCSAGLKTKGGVEGGGEGVAVEGQLLCGCQAMTPPVVALGTTADRSRGAERESTQLLPAGIAYTVGTREMTGTALRSWGGQVLEAPPAPVVLPNRDGPARQAQPWLSAARGLKLNWEVLASQVAPKFT